MTMKTTIVKRLAAASTAVLLCTGFAGASITATGGGDFSASPPGWDQPPTSLGSIPMTDYDNFDPFLAVFATTTTATSDAASTHTTTFSSSVSHRHIGAGWATWSGGYDGSVYFHGGTSLTLTMSPGTTAFSLFFESDPFDLHNFTLTGTDSGGNMASLSQDAHGSAGATWVGFHTVGTTLSQITINSDDGVGFAVGRFSYGTAVLPAPGALALLGLAGLTGVRRRRN